MEYLSVMWITVSFSATSVAQSFSVKWIFSPDVFLLHHQRGPQSATHEGISVPVFLGNAHVTERIIVSGLSRYITITLFRLRRLIFIFLWSFKCCDSHKTCKITLKLYWKSSVTIQESGPETLWPQSASVWSPDDVCCRSWRLKLKLCWRSSSTFCARRTCSGKCCYVKKAFLQIDMIELLGRADYSDCWPLIRLWICSDVCFITDETQSECLAL